MRKIGKIKVSMGFGEFRPIGNVECLLIKLSEIVSITGYEESTLIGLSNGQQISVRDLVNDIMTAIEQANV